MRHHAKRDNHGARRKSSQPSQAVPQRPHQRAPPLPLLLTPPRSLRLFLTSPWTLPLLPTPPLSPTLTAKAPSKSMGPPHPGVTPLSETAACGSAGGEPSSELHDFPARRMFRAAHDAIFGRAASASSEAGTPTPSWRARRTSATGSWSGCRSAMPMRRPLTSRCQRRAPRGRRRCPSTRATTVRSPPRSSRLLAPRK